MAEKVEILDQLQSLRDMKCDGAQGFYFMRPVDPEPFSRLLLAGRSVQWKEPLPGAASDRAEFELDAASAT